MREKAAWKLLTTILVMYAGKLVEKGSGQVNKVFGFGLILGAMVAYVLQRRRSRLNGMINVLVLSGLWLALR